MMIKLRLTGMFTSFLAQRVGSIVMKTWHFAGEAELNVITESSCLEPGFHGYSTLSTLGNFIGYQHSTSTHGILQGRKKYGEITPLNASWDFASLTSCKAHKTT